MPDRRTLTIIAVLAVVAAVAAFLLPRLAEYIIGGGIAGAVGVAKARGSIKKAVKSSEERHAVEVVEVAAIQDEIEEAQEESKKSAVSRINSRFGL